jgi:hypothetical protein
VGLLNGFAQGLTTGNGFGHYVPGYGAGNFASFMPAHAISDEKQVQLSITDYGVFIIIAEQTNIGGTAVKGVRHETKRFLKLKGRD